MRIVGFLGLFTATGDDTPPGYASSCLNVRVGDGRIRPRWGYRLLADAPSGLTSVHGFAHLRGYDDAYAPVEEWLTVEDRGEGPRPYAVTPGTWSRTEITAGGTSVTLDPGEWRGVVFGPNAYLMNPKSTKSVYRHRIGDPTSWTALQDSDYVPPETDDRLSVEALANLVVSFGHGETVTVDPDYGIDNPTTAVVDGALVVSGKNGSDTSEKTDVTVEFAAPVDWSGSAYLGLRVGVGVVYDDFSVHGYAPQIKVGGVWTNAPIFRQFVRSRNDWTLVVCLKGIARTAVEGVRFRTMGHCARNASGIAFTVESFQLGGTYLRAPSDAARIWDSDWNDAQAGNDGPRVEYAIRYATVGASPVYGETHGVGVASGPALGIALGGGPPLGGQIALTANGTNVAPWTHDPSGTSAQIQFLRQEATTGKWRVLGVRPNDDGQTLTDTREEWELAALPEATGVAYVPPDPAPPFQTGSLVGAFPFKGSMVWLYRGGIRNLRYSRVGDAEAQATDASAGDADPDDLGRPANFTMADDFADEPLGGAQAGNVAVILGRRGVYRQSGEVPSGMTPPSQIPGARGCAGRGAFAPCKGDDGAPGVAYVDAAGEGVWFVGTAQLFAGDAAARPVELSEGIRGFLRCFLLAGRDDLASIRLDVDPATGSLWVVLGARALVLRPASRVDGNRPWEPYAYALPPGATGFAGLAFSPDRRLLALTHGGHLAALEWDFDANAFIEGPNRDGGNPMPPGWWESGRDAGDRRRLAHLAVDRESLAQPVAVVAYCDGDPLGRAATVLAKRRWTRFGPGQIGFAHRVRIGVDETTIGVTGLEAVFHTLSPGLDR